MAGLVQLDNNGNLIELGTPIDVSTGALTTWTSRSLAVTTTPVEVTAGAPLAGRKTITLKASNANTENIYLGPDNGVSAASATLAPGEGLTLELDATAAVGAAAQTGSENLSIVEVA